MKTQNVKKRNWAGVIYEDSAPENWREILQETGLQCAVSPLHDKDFDPDGNPKKAHRHVIVTYSGPTTFNVVKALFDKLNAPRPIALEQVRGYYRYLTHKDNPEKAQYSEEDIICINGFNIRDFVELTRSEVGRIKSELCDLCRALSFTEYAQLVDYSQAQLSFDYFDVVCSNTLFFDRYLSSRRHSRPAVNVDPNTGEVV